MFYFHFLDLNVNEWVGIWTNELYGVNTTSVKTLDEL